LTPSERIAVPRIKDAPVSMECTFMQEVALSNFSLVLGRILLVHVCEDAVIAADRQRIDASKLDLIGRMEGGWYTRTTERFEMPNIPLEDWRREQHQGWSVRSAMNGLRYVTRIATHSDRWAVLVAAWHAKDTCRLEAVER
jgi:hypothetical protein